MGNTVHGGDPEELRETDGLDWSSCSGMDQWHLSVSSSPDRVRSSIIDVSEHEGVRTSPVPII